MNLFLTRSIACAILSCICVSALSQERKQVGVTRIESAPLIDGTLNEAVWQQADVITDFHQIRPGDGTEPSEPTEVYLLYTDDALYIGAYMHDPEPELIAAPTIRHGQGLGGDDRLVVILDPFNTGRNGYRFETNLNAVRHDALYTSVSSFQSDWSVIWDVATSVTDDGWIAEIEIPFKSLPLDTNIEEWGFNFGRGIRRRGEEMAWVSRNRNYNPSILGLATGLSGMDQGIGLDIVPSLSVSQKKLYSPSDKDTNTDPSLDIYYRLTPSLNSALTINTDFSATEVDNRQVNLTRFNLFFPEKRDFFLNDSDFFQFGGIGGGFGGNQATSRPDRESGRPYFSRKIGLSETGVPVDINYGGRISGRVGRWSIGSLAIQQDKFGLVDTSNLFVGRLAMDVLSESAVGVIFTDGNPTSNLDNSLMGADFHYLNTNLSGGRVLEGDVWFQQTQTPGLDGEDSAYSIGVKSPNNTGLRGGIALKEIGKNFNPALGFVSRTDIRDITADLGFTHFFNSDLLQSVFFGLDGERIESLDGELQSEVLVARLFDLQTNSRDSVNLRYTLDKEVVLNPFVIYSDETREIVIEPGSYEFGETRIGFQTGNQRTFSGGLSFQAGDFYNGTRNQVGASFSWAQSRYFLMSMNFNWNDIELPQGDFITRLYSLSTQVAFSSTLYWISLVQYDNVSENLGINTRLQWIPTAGQEGFIVLNHNMQDSDKDNSFDATFSELSIKFKYTFRY